MATLNAELVPLAAALIVLVGGLGLGWVLVTLVRGLWAVGTLIVRGRW